MARKYCDCGRKIVVFKCKGYKGVKQGKEDHDLCQKCWESFRDSNRDIQYRRITERKRPKEIPELFYLQPGELGEPDER